VRVCASLHGIHAESRPPCAFAAMYAPTDIGANTKILTTTRS